ncbi:spermidine/putrescine transport system substrate-binding protein [Propionicimonas paludicola]|uniref:Spermidine/putrescine transport system substrate-binding protein n=1 Tax=Propionicimonas paludicola TaxID=185243 RepID=A0A2A9CT72_9ACTN|nr:spermidine/putrescine ABC transporter substrate-binding protein [Propionicimonas paludicola]PFG17361.1 spermidine/putrescine transport system substrate-binding protein [Propionicimonas paludicola]
MSDEREISALTASLARSALTRRSVLGGLAGLGAAGLLAACGTPGRKPSGGASSADGTPSPAKTPLAATDLSDTDKIVNWSNWPQYIDVGENDDHPTIAAFTKKTGIKVNYNEDYNDNDEFFAKVRPLLEAGKDTGRDVWVSTDWMVARMIRLGYLQPLDKANIPNAANLEPTLANVEFDPGRVYSLPWQSIFAGIAYNPKATGGKKITTMDQLLHDPALKGKVTLLTEMRDTVGLVMMEQGKKLASFTAADFADAIAVLQAAKDAGQIKGFTGNEYTKPLASGDTAACVAWTGDVVQLRADNPALGYALPTTGFTMSSDNFVIPAMAQHKKNAEKLINYYYDPEVMAAVVEYVNYVGPVVGIKDILTKSDPSVAKNELIFPTAETLANGQVFRSLTAEEETTFTRQFQSLVTG